MVNTTGYYITHGASFFLTLRIRQSSERYVVLVFHGLRKAGYCLWIITVSTTAFAIGYKLIKVTSNRS